MISDILVTWLNKKTKELVAHDLTTKTCPPEAFDRRYHPRGREYGEFVKIDKLFADDLTMKAESRNLLAKRLAGGLQGLIRRERRIVVVSGTFEIIINDITFPEWEGKTVAWRCVARIVKKTWLKKMGLRESPEEEFERVTGSKFVA